MTAPTAARMSSPPLSTAAAVVALLDRERPGLCGLLRHVADTSRPVPGLDWTLGQLGLHMATGTELYLDILGGTGKVLAYGRRPWLGFGLAGLLDVP